MKLLFRMTPRGTFYSGSRFVDNYNFPFPRSDTVFKAILHAWTMLWGETATKDLVDRYLQGKTAEDLPFYISSVFPVIENIYFLPHPISMNIEIADQTSLSSNIDFIQWVSPELYRKWLKKQPIYWSPEFFLHPSLYFDEKEEAAIRSASMTQAWSDDRGRTRIFLDRITTQLSVYPANQVFYAEKMDYYLVADVQQEYQDKLASAFRLLADDGIGGRRSIGCGSYAYHAPISLPDALDFISHSIDNSFITLSLYHPTVEDVKGGVLQNAKFRLLERQGWNKDAKGHAVKQHKIRVLCEGSHFYSPNSSSQSMLPVGEATSTNCAFYHYVYPFRVTAPGVEA